MRIFLILLPFLFLISCKEDVQKKPEDIWSEEKFTNALVEVQITEAYIRLGYNRSQESFRHKDSLFQSTFRKLETNKGEFEKNFDYYSNHPKLMDKIYEEVIERLSERQAEIQGESEEQEGGQQGQE